MTLTYKILPDDIKPHVIALLKLMQLANDKWPSDVYRDVQNALRSLLAVHWHSTIKTDEVLGRFAEICGGFTYDELEEAYHDIVYAS